jgi:hypothetical protein
MHKEDGEVMRKKEDNYTEGNKQRRYKEMKPLNINHIQ